MFADGLFAEFGLDDLQIEMDDFLMGFRDRYGSHGVGRSEDDPEMEQYEELMELGQSLGRRGW